MERSFLSRFVKYFYVCPLCDSFHFQRPAIDSLLACNLFGIGPQSHRYVLLAAGSTFSITSSKCAISLTSGLYKRKRGLHC